MRDRARGRAGSVDVGTRAGLDDDLLPADAARVVAVAVHEPAAVGEPRRGEQHLETGRAQARLPRREGEDVLHRSERDRAAAHRGLDALGQRTRQRSAVGGLTLGVHVRPRLEGRDLGHVEHVEDVEAVARGLDPAVAVDREVAEGGARGAAGGTASAAERRPEGEQSRLSSRVPPRDRRPEHREVRVQRERAPEPGARGAGVAEAALDHPAVEELERVLRAEPQRAPRVAERLGAAAVPRERPAEHVVAVDRGPVVLADPGQGERVLRRDAVVDVEERDLEVGLDAVRAQQPLDRADQRVLPAAREAGMAGDAVEVAQRRDVLRQRESGRRPRARARSRGGSGRARPRPGPARRARRRSRGRPGCRGGTRARRRRGGRGSSRACRAGRASRRSARRCPWRRRPRASSPLIAAPVWPISSRP